MSAFQSRLSEARYELKKSSIKTLQINLGKLCNLTCSHCHVEAGPTKTQENMNRKTAEAVVHLMEDYPFETLDLTGGAPEMNPYFRFLVEAAEQNELHVIDRCNLTLFFEKGYEDLPEYLAQHSVEVVASLPCYKEANVDQQRGQGTFQLSIKALQRLNRLGYGRQSQLKLNLVYNPVGPHLPPSQETLEAEYRRRLKQDYDIDFHSLYTITNVPITRFKKYLQALKAQESYQTLLENHFNPATLDALMCRDTLNVGWDGTVYDCDFNQMIDLPMANGKPLTVFNLNVTLLNRFRIATGEHCFACTAGAGSSCRGALKGVSLSV